MAVHKLPCLIPHGLAALLALGLAAAQAAGPAPAQDGVSAWIDGLGAATQAGPVEGWNAQLDAEAAVARQIRERIAASPGAPELSQPDAKGQTPLIRAALRGYPLVVQALLADAGVRAGLDARDRDGLSAWMAAQFARPLTLASCHPQVLVREAVGLWGANLRRIGYFAQQPAMPFERIRQLLGAAGAKPDLDAAKRYWLAQCPGHDPALDPAIAASEDLMATLLADSNPRLQAFFAELQSEPRPFPPKALPPQPILSASSATPLQPGASGMICPELPKPDRDAIGSIQWSGNVRFRVVVEVQDGVPVTATTSVRNNTQVPPEAAVVFRFTYYRALGSYRCAGDHLIQQEFDLKFR